MPSAIASCGDLMSRTTPSTTFRALTDDVDATLIVVARFLALLDLYRDGAVAFEQVAPLGELHVRWIAADGFDIAGDRIDAEPRDSE